MTGPVLSLSRICCSAEVSHDRRSSSFLMVTPVNFSSWGFGSSSFAAAPMTLLKRAGRASRMAFNSLSLVLCNV